MLRCRTYPVIVTGVSSQTGVRITGCTLWQGGDDAVSSEGADLPLEDEIVLSGGVVDPVQIDLGIGDDSRRQ